MKHTDLLRQWPAPDRDDLMLCCWFVISVHLFGVQKVPSEKKNILSKNEPSTYGLLDPSSSNFVPFFS